MALHEPSFSLSLEPLTPRTNPLLAFKNRLAQIPDGLSTKEEIFWESVNRKLSSIIDPAFVSENSHAVDNKYIFICNTLEGNSVVETFIVEDLFSVVLPDTYLAESEQDQIMSLEIVRGIMEEAYNELYNHNPGFRQALED